ncbi:MAG: magnesium transporter CorA family protein [Burkholderiaceae bacterium]
MQIVEFRPGTLRFAEDIPADVPRGGFVWIFLDREEFEASTAKIQKAAQALGGSQILDLHLKDMSNASHPSHYDYTSVYDRIVFRRLATPDETGAGGEGSGEKNPFRRIETRAVTFVVFDRLLISVHPGGCFTAKSFIQRYLADAVHSEGSAAARSRLPTSPSDLMLRMVNLMVDSYLELRKPLGAQLDRWQQELLRPKSVANWHELMAVRGGLHALEDLCEEQQDAMQEWLDTLREQPPESMERSERDNLITRARDVVEHVQRVMHHVRRMEQGAETAVQIHFSVQSNRTNDIMRTLTALTAIFLPLNLIAGIFGMNFEFLPFAHARDGFWWAVASMVLIALVLGVIFWRKHYLARTSR